MYVNMALSIHTNSMFTPCLKYGVNPNQHNATFIDELMQQDHIPDLYSRRGKRTSSIFISIWLCNTRFSRSRK